MRAFEKTQMCLSEVAIENIKIDSRSRDEIPQILFGLQYIYSNDELKEQVMDILKKIIPEGVDQNFGRPGMELWKILVLGCIRLGCNIDFDKLHNLANYHSQVREFLFHSSEDRHEYSLSSIRENIQKFTPEVLDEISELVVKAGHKLIKKKAKKRASFQLRPAVIRS